MRFIYEENKKLPPLAWLAIVKGEIVRVIHGQNVEVESDFFVEGAWNGDFLSGDFINCDWFCGSGAKLTSASVVFQHLHMLQVVFFHAKLKMGLFCQILYICYVHMKSIDLTHNTLIMK